MALFMSPSLADSALAAVVAGYGGMVDPSRRPDDGVVWVRMSRPLADGTYMTDLCSSSAELRGTGLHRWMWAVERFASYQRKPDVVTQNRWFMNPELFRRLYAEIDEIVPSLRHCLGPEASPTWTTSTYSERRVELDMHAQKVYEWIDRPDQWRYEWSDGRRTCTGGSTICALAEWQAGGGVSFEAVMHHRAARCFKYHGNEQHDFVGAGVSLGEFQRAVRWLGLQEWEPGFDRVVRARTDGGGSSVAVAVSEGVESQARGSVTPHASWASSGDFD